MFMCCCCYDNYVIIIFVFFSQSAPRTRPPPPRKEIPSQPQVENELLAKLKRRRNKGNNYNYFNKMK